MSTSIKLFKIFIHIRYKDLKSGKGREKEWSGVKNERNRERSDLVVWNLRDERSEVEIQ